MKVRLTLNIGKPDANRLGIVDPSDGAIATVDEKAGAELVSKGWAVAYGDDADVDDLPTARDFKAIPPRNEIETTTEASADPVADSDRFDIPPRRGPGRPRTRPRPEPA